MGKMIELRNEQGERFEAWYAEPNYLQHPQRQPGIVFLAEAFNLNAWARNTVDALSRRGYRVIAPDLHWRTDPGVHLAYGPENRIRAMALYAQLEDELAMDDVRTCLAYMHNQPSANTKSGVMGFCVGGRLALRLAANAPKGLQLAIGYYSSDIGPHTALGASLKVPALFHFGATDPAIPMSVVNELAHAGRHDQRLNVHVYEDAGHGFCRIGEPHFNADAYAQSQERTTAFLNALLPSNAVNI